MGQQSSTLRPRSTSLSLSVVLLAMFGWAGMMTGCNNETNSTLDTIAESYVRLVLDTGRHEEHYVDAYYGPAEWREAADAGEPKPLDQLLARSRELLHELGSQPANPRRSFLEKQLIAVEAFLRRTHGETMTLTEEARLLYDIEAPRKDRVFFEKARTDLEALLPGGAPLEQRVEEFRKKFHIDPKHLDDVVRAVLEESRRLTAEHVSLPQGENFRHAFVTDKPWSGYNWYQGDYQSLIEFNTDLPQELGALMQTIPHEGYPGHHTYNSLLEDRLVRNHGWIEYTVYPLYSPQSLLAEGTANAGVDVILPDAAMLTLMRDTLAPLAGLRLNADDFAKYHRLLKALEPFRFARGEAARMLLDDGAAEDDVIGFLTRYGLQTEERAKKSIDFIRTYRSYVFNYVAGEDLVHAFIGSGADRTSRFFNLLQRPAVPSELVSQAE